jgi:hypothetical protein
MGVEKVSRSDNLKLELSNLEFHISKTRLGPGFGKSMVSADFMSRTLNSVVKTYIKHTSKLASEATKSHLVKEAEALGISLSEYLVMLAKEHEKFQQYPSQDLNVVFIRFITRLIKTTKDHSEIVHELQEVRESLNKSEAFATPKVDEAFFKQIARSRLQTLLS